LVRNFSFKETTNELICIVQLKIVLIIERRVFVGLFLHTEFLRTCVAADSGIVEAREIGRCKKVEGEEEKVAAEAEEEVVAEEKT